MSEILLISGSPRLQSNSATVCRLYADLLRERGREFGYVDIADFPADTFGTRPDGSRHPFLVDLTERQVRPSNRLIIVSPEYNGSIPGLLKALIDSTDISAWKGKKVLLTGVATGRAGNLRGMDHLANIMLHVASTVHPNKLPISSFNNLIGEDGLLDETTRESCGKQLDSFLDF